MRAASAPRERAETRLLLLEPSTGRLEDRRAAELPALLGDGDLLVVNDAATLPSSQPVVFPSGARGEARLIWTWRGWRAVLFGAGDWRTPTEHRPAPEVVAVGARIVIGALTARVMWVSPVSPRLVELEFAVDADTLWAGLYRHGRPVQYAHVPDPLALWSVQTVFAGRPWSAELPSAGLPLDGAMLVALRARGVGVVAITHGCGLSATGDPALDAVLPLPERTEVGTATVAAITAARARRGRVIAVGTSVVRALESATATGRLVAVSGETDLLIGPGFQRRVVDGMLTGIHDPSATHFALLQAFAPREVLERAYGFAARLGYLGHELGDMNLILEPGRCEGRAA